MGYSQTTSKEKTNTFAKDAEQQKLLRQMLQLYGPQAGKGEPMYPGETVAPLTELQTGALGATKNVLDSISSPGGTSPLYGQAMSTLSDTMAGTTGAQPITGEQAADYYQNVIAGPAMKGLKETTLPVVQESFSGPGYWGSARAGATTKAAQDLESGLTSQRSQLGWDVVRQNQAIEEAKAGRALSAVEPSIMLPVRAEAQAGQNQATKIANLQGIYGMGAQEQAQKQAYIDAELEKFAQEHNITSDKDLAIIMALLEMNFGYSTGRASTRSFTIA